MCDSNALPWWSQDAFTVQTQCFVIFGPFWSFFILFGHNLLYHFFVGNGNAVPWWSQETIDAFTVQAQCFVDQYGNYSVPEIASIVGEENAHVLSFFSYYCQLGCGISRAASKYLTPSPWLVHFFRSGKNPQEQNPQHLGY